MFPLFETIRVIDGNLINLDFHESRFKYSFLKLFNEIPLYKLKDVIIIPDKFLKGLVKTRFCYNKNNFKIDFSFYSLRNIKTLKIIVSNSLDYSLKYTDRSSISTLFEQRGNADDILIVKNGFVTDTSIANIIFQKGGKWFTPDTPLLKGTCREKLLQENKIFINKISTDDLSSYKEFSLINAMISTEILKPLPIHNIQY